MKLISQVYGEQPFVVVLPSESKKGVGSLDESLSEALLSGAPFIVLENVRGQIASQLLESAIRGEGKVAVRRAYSRTTLIDTDHVYWMATSNQVQMTRDLANRSIITRLRKRPEGSAFKEYPERELGSVWGIGEPPAFQKKYFCSATTSKVRYRAENWKSKK